MRTSYLRSLVVAALFSPVGALAGQSLPSGARPSPAQAQTILQARPDLVQQLRQRFATSGLTKEQVHARLRAEGYPEDLLDGYLPGVTGTPAEPTDDVFRAVRALGVADSADVAALQAGALSAQAARAATPITAFLDDTLRAARTGSDTLRIVAAAADSGFTIFGLDVFRGSTSQFEANLAGPVDAGYRLGPGDKLVLILTGDVEASYQLDVTREGFVVVPQVGQIYVANVTLGQLQSLMNSRLSRAYSGIGAGTTRFSISVARLRSNQVYVVGDVQRPGSYMVSSAGTTLTALYAAGGPTINGSLRRIEIRRDGRVVDALDVYDYLVRGDASHDVRLQTGDVVFVPVHGARVRVVGEIARPATYELKPGETLADLVRAAGGFRATASRQRVLIERILAPEQRVAVGHDRVTIDVASDAALAGTGVALQNGDVVRVFPIAERVRNRVIVQGNVYQAGSQGFTPGMKLSDALRRAGLQPDTYLGEVLVTRLRSDSTREQLRATLADSAGHVVNDLPLQEDDEIHVYSLTTFRPDRYVAIGGAVKNGGRFPYRSGMTLRDLVLLANGVQESAYLREAEIARLPESRDSGRTATTIRVPLDSTYLFERSLNGTYIGPPGVPSIAAGAPEVLLKPYDNVLILRQPNWELQRTVVLSGEVRFPGAYALKNKTERLSDVIGRAGGLSDEAYADGIVFVRGQGGVGRVGVDLASALRHYEGSDNLILRDGDQITIPAYNSIVSIRGAVNQPSTVAYVAGKGIDYYINAAGGAARNGDDGHAYVTQPSGKLESVHHRFLLPASMPKPRPGSVVTVPDKDPADKKDYVALTGTVAQIIASTVAIIVALKR
ncbi:MAG: polysaccharide export protein [Gemmatimonadetes bacterium]|nr:polysaccharide export protein [Gemmatimonadota bacterium]